MPRTHLHELVGEVGASAARVPAPPATVARTVRLDRVAANPLNARDVQAHPERIAELAESLRQHGQLQPCAVVTRDAFTALFPEREPDVSGADYVQVTGARRRAAAVLAGLPTLDIAVKDALAASRPAFIAATAAENLDREDYDPVEEATQVAVLVAECGTQKDAAEQLRRTAPWVTQRLNLLKLEPELQDALRAGEIPVREVRELHRASRSDQLAALARWRAQVAARERRGQQGDQAPAVRLPRAVAAVQRLGKTSADEVAHAMLAELPADYRRALADALLRDLNGR